MPEVEPLTDREVAILDFEKQQWKYAGAKEDAIRRTFEISPTRYRQVLNALLDHQAALAAEPVLIKRLRRLRDERRRARRTTPATTKPAAKGPLKPGRPYPRAG